jgi:hypothetical protein
LPFVVNIHHELHFRGHGPWSSFATLGAQSNSAWTSE